MAFFRRLLLLLAAVLFCAGSLPALAQRVYWDPGFGELPAGTTSVINLAFENCAPAAGFELPTIPGLELGRPMEGQQTTADGRGVTQLFILSFPVRPTRNGEIVIPAFDAATTRGRVAVGEVRYNTGRQFDISEAVTSHLRPATASLWAGEVADIEYTVLASPQFTAEIVTAPEWQPPGLIAEPWGRPERTSETRGGEDVAGLTYRTRFLATQPGTVQPEAVRQTVNVQTGSRFGFGLRRAQVESFTIESNRPELNIKPLPPPPPGFTGAVGDFALESKIVPETARVGEPITWTMTLRGVGNWPAHPTLPVREVVRDFQVVQPQGRQSMDDDRLFSGSLTEDAVLVPTRPGTYAIGPVKFVWFDTARGAYQEDVVPAVTVTILPTERSPAPDSEMPEGTATAPTTPGSGDDLRPLPDDLVAPGALPRDPLPLPGSGLAPRELAWWWWLPLAFVPPALLWLALAWRTMVRADPYVARRAARSSLERLLAARARTAAPLDHGTLVAWHRLTAQLWQVNRATPTLDDLDAALLRLRGAPRPEDWLTLWQEAEDALYSASHGLPADWSSRALTTVRAVRLHRTQSPLPLRRSYWRPALTTIVVAAMWCAAFPLASESHGAGRESAANAYREGRFAAAHAAWSLELASRPRDAALRNNLALALAQEGDWAGAAAHWTAAFLLNPRAPAIRENLRLALTHLDGVDPQLRRLVEGSRIDRAITILAPGEWQGVYFAGGLLVSVALGLLVTVFYATRGRSWRLRLAFTLLPIGVAASAAGFSAHRLYGPLGSPDAGLIAGAAELHSIPTDLAEAQQTEPISAGAVVVRRGEFLGWVRVDAAHPGSGWLREELLIPFFHAPAERSAPGTSM